MTIVTIPPELEAPLAEAARQRGTTPELLAVESLWKIYAPSAAAANSTTSATLRDFLDGYVGTVAGASEPLSDDTGRKFADMLVEKPAKP